MSLDGLEDLKYLESFEILEYLDARNNSLNEVSPEIKDIMQRKEGLEFYFSGNPVCVKDRDLNCSSLCTDFCWSETGFKNGVCDDSCNSLACHFDGGDCRS